jgi:peptide/nickel transport system ATP-binding protein
MSDLALEVTDLEVGFASGGVIVDDVSLELAAGEILGIVGESGSGKTTTALALLGYCRPGARITHGNVVIAGKQLIPETNVDVRKARGRLVSYVPQDASVSLNPAMRIGVLIDEILRTRGVRDGVGAARREALERVHLPTSDEFARRFPHQLSGGQQQRVALAMALLGSPPVVVLDEPTTGLDVVTQRRILTEIRRLRDETGTAMVYVSHDLAAVNTLADRIAVMYAGRIVESGPTKRTLHRPYHPYTVGLISAAPTYEPGSQLQGIDGVAVGVDNRPAGCAFAPRCFNAVGHCLTAQPPVERPVQDATVRCFEWKRTPLPEPTEGSATAVQRSTEGALLNVEHLVAVHTTRKGTVTAADDISFSVRPGETLALVGESGSGKTTIARCVAGLHEPSSGSLTLEGQKLAGRARSRPRNLRRDIQIVFQNPYESLNPRRPIGPQVARPAQQLRGLGRAEANREVGVLLERVRLPAGVARRYATELSGGERQRVAIARALAARPKLLVCDEITSALDVSVQAAVIELLMELRDTLQLSLVFISHDLGVVASIADYGLVLEHGRLREAGPIADLLSRPQHGYTQQLVTAAPRISRDRQVAADGARP